MHSRLANSEQEAIVPYLHHCAPAKCILPVAGHCNAVVVDTYAAGLAYSHIVEMGGVVPVTLCKRGCRRNYCQQAKRQDTIASVKHREGFSTIKILPKSGCTKKIRGNTEARILCGDFIAAHYSLQYHKSQ